MLFQQFKQHQIIRTSLFQWRVREGLCSSYLPSLDLRRWGVYVNRIATVKDQGRTIKETEHSQTGVTWGYNISTSDKNRTKCIAS